MPVDISDLSRKELEKLQKEVEKALAQIEKQERKDARKAAEKAAAKYGFTLAELTNGAAGGKKPGEAAAPKYANPDNPTQTWSGRGRQPQWFKDAVEGGKEPAEMEL